jgi:hypothetical protein
MRFVDYANSLHRLATMDAPDSRLLRVRRLSGMQTVPGRVVKSVVVIGLIVHLFGIWALRFAWSWRARGPIIFEAGAGQGVFADRTIHVCGNAYLPGCCRRAARSMGELETLILLLTRASGTFNQSVGELRVLTVVGSSLAGQIVCSPIPSSEAPCRKRFRDLRVSERSMA